MIDSNQRKQRLNRLIKEYRKVNDHQELINKLKNLTMNHIKNKDLYEEKLHELSYDDAYNKSLFIKVAKRYMKQASKKQVLYMLMDLIKQKPPLYHEKASELLTLIEEKYNEIDPELKSVIYYEISDKHPVPNEQMTNKVLLNSIKDLEDDQKLHAINTFYQNQQLGSIDQLYTFTSVNKIEENNGTSSAVSPLVTVIVPIKHHIDYIDQSLYTLMNQTYSSIEFIFISVYSAKSLTSYCQSLISHSNINFFQVNSQLSVPQMLNQAIDYAKGEYITVHQLNEWAHPERIHYQVSDLENSKKQANRLKALKFLSDRFEPVDDFYQYTFTRYSSICLKTARLKDEGLKWTDLLNGYFKVFDHDLQIVLKESITCLNVDGLIVLIEADSLTNERYKRALQHANVEFEDILKFHNDKKQRLSRLQKLPSFFSGESNTFDIIVCGGLRDSSLNHKRFVENVINNINLNLRQGIIKSTRKLEQNNDRSKDMRAYFNKDLRVVNGEDHVEAELLIIYDYEEFAKVIEDTPIMSVKAVKLVYESSSKSLVDRFTKVIQFRQSYEAIIRKTGIKPIVHPVNENSRKELKRIKQSYKRAEVSRFMWCDHAGSNSYQDLLMAHLPERSPDHV
ncbi:Glycosyltransferase involved in cell wall bisynthesis [Pelagirhabdus alkalitolerans]|uniref:Glycosyltransferase involved in cell wall bisynthesis n=1 Tax=Pelagirhabdus alkalitolerans TaxID=1612202 RepID=A0A1G6GJA0_9BACI|nr:glycosyltransferase family 2 protein [Pelagirhabdus alkalitolerans]SDB81266.1 Glycosyltransferase involved in cell wall bisynthesis [Pelagirhabdus alkalitolerans]